MPTIPCTIRFLEFILVFIFKEAIHFYFIITQNIYMSLSQTDKPRYIEEVQLLFPYILPYFLPLLCITVKNLLCSSPAS